LHLWDIQLQSHCHQSLKGNKISIARHNSSFDPPGIISGQLFFAEFGCRLWSLLVKQRLLVISSKKFLSRIKTCYLYKLICFGMCYCPDHCISMIYKLYCWMNGCKDTFHTRSFTTGFAAFAESGMLSAHTSLLSAQTLPRVYSRHRALDTLGPAKSSVSRNQTHTTRM
jgi:hypothetical protein